MGSIAVSVWVWWWIVCAVCVGASVASLPYPSPVTSINNGSLVGNHVGNIAYFLGIPYAAPPTGSLRFKPPIPYQRKWWSRLSFFFFPSCPQVSFTGGDMSLSEDCLYLNVFTPNTTKGVRLPVMVFIHGGGYVMGGANEFPARGVLNLAGKGVVIVTFNYRLNVFGFFSDGGSEYAGNVGMLDQVQALRWVRDEIDNFGGDPNRVTIFGQSAGAASVSMHTFSPKSTGLFHQAIMESGSAFCPGMIFGGKSQFPTSSADVAIASGCINQTQWDSRDFSEFTGCIQNITWRDLLTLAAKTVPMGPMSWSPSVGTLDGFMPTWPRFVSSQRMKNMPIIVGANQNEDYLTEIIPLLSGSSTPADQFNAAQFQKEMDSMSTIAEWGEFVPQIRDTLHSSYYPAQPNITKWFSAITRMKGDQEYYYGVVNEAMSASQTTNNLYVYSFDYLSDGYPWPSTENSTQRFQGAYHGMELNFLFNSTTIPGSTHPWTFSDADKAVSEMMAVMWTNFAKTGNPNMPESVRRTWLPFQSGLKSYVSINYPYPSLKINFHKKADYIWNVQVPKFTQQNGPTFPPFSGNGTTPHPPNACDLSPCENNSTCTSLLTGGYRCLCSSEWMGTNCSLSACSVRVKSSGAYVLQITYQEGENAFKTSYLTSGNELALRAVAQTTLQLHAVAGKKTSITLSPTLCAQNPTFHCSGTTFVGFKCSKQ